MYQGSWVRHAAVLGLTLLLAGGREAGAAVDPGEGTERPPGVVVVFPVLGEAPPGIEQTLHLLEVAGIQVPPYGTQFSDGWTFLGSSEESYRLLGNLEPVACPDERAPVDPATLDAVLQAANRLIVLTEYQQAVERLAEAWEALPCARTRIPRATLYRLPFLLGVAEEFLEHDERAARWFRLAAAIDTQYPFDNRFPPKVLEAFGAGWQELVAIPPTLLKVNVGEATPAVYLDGEPLDIGKPMSLRVGFHLVQIQGAESDPETGLETLAFELQTPDPVWVVDKGVTGRIDALRRTQATGVDTELLVDRVSAWAVRHGQSWALLVFPDAGGHTLSRVLFVDVSVGAVTPQPAWLAPSLATGGSSTGTPSRAPRAETVRQVAADWEFDAGSILFQPVAMPSARLYGIEVGGVRTIVTPYAAHVSVGAGLNVVAGKGVEGTFSSFLAGVRRVWERTPLGLYVEGGLGGFRVSGTPSTLSLYVRPGAYYSLPPSRRSTVGFWLGTEFVFVSQAGSHWLGLFGIEYRRLW